ncbi:hypothetical protein GCM10010172_39310 [Paractinoplanes ferrugineus]|uniref:Uncharacterized protein n=1 Tax=Paractinoplanes ferrugineus TaxID=113564 RepID=A0A919MLZ1_9ACTN|nr:hypothetical protein [Actinoplanes ferrugineus]GIE12707.1 hypothetical protein Afe05nite_45470 [Actinoplanes ferrugineus]
MERRIDLSNLDLDEAAALIGRRRAKWLRLGLIVETPTWIDNEADWPAPLLTDREQVRRPMSLGLRLQGQASEAQFVLYAGGWVDVDYVPVASDEVITEYVELNDVHDFAALVDRVAARLTGNR